MSDLALKLTESLFNALRLDNAERGMLNGYFEKHAKNVDENKLAARTLETVLTSLESNPAITGLHREVLQNLIHVLKNEATGTQEKQSIPTKVIGLAPRTSTDPPATHRAFKPLDNQLVRTSKHDHDVTSRIVCESPSTGSSVGSQKEPNLKDPNPRDDENSNQHDSSSSATSGAKLNGTPGIEMDLAMAPLSNGNVTHGMQHVQSESPDQTSSSRLGLADVPTKPTPASPFTTVMTSDSGPVKSGHEKISDRKLLPHEWREPIPLKTSQASEAASTRADKDEAVESFVQQLRKNNGDAPWVGESPNTNKDKIADYKPWGTYQPENPGYHSRRGDHRGRGRGRGGRSRGGNSTRGNQPPQNDIERQNHGKGRGTHQDESQISIRTPPRRPRHKHDGSISVFGWGPGSEEQKVSFKKWKTAAQRKGSPTPSESVSQFTAGFTSDIAENLRNHPPKCKEEIW
ncbi:hypothetical protein K445DRAFT_368085 [Daldinia sp. EC12]|nr:hypothetical protein K445DRAFT_368085 [Daldinia sp. EC12]